VLACFGALALWHAAYVPLFEGPDEPDNLAYVRFLVEEGRLTEPTIEESHELEQLGRGHMPPLWFLTLVPVFDAVGAREWRVTAALNPDFYRRASTPESDPQELLARPTSRLAFRHGLDERTPLSGAGRAVRTLRTTTVAWALLALWATWRAARTVVGGDGRRATWLVAFGASLPMLQHLAGTVTMDLMLAALGALALWACVEWCAGAGSAGARTARWAAAAGAASGLAALTKLNGLVLVPACVAAGVLAWRRGAALLRPALACALAFALVAGPYYLWGWIESGHPLWSWRYQQVSPFHAASAGPPTGWDAVGVATFAFGLFSTWLGNLGWTAVWFPLWIAGAAFLVHALGAASFVARLVRAVPPPSPARADSDDSEHGEDEPPTARPPSLARSLVARLAAAALVAGALFCVHVWIDGWIEGFGGAAWERWATWAAVAAVAVAVALRVLAPYWRAGATPRACAYDGTALAFLGLASACILAAEVYFNLHFGQPQARHLYPFLAALVLCVGVGLEELGVLRAAVVGQAVLSVGALVLVAVWLRPPGWNEDPLWAVTDFGRGADPALADRADGGRPAGAAIGWLAPEAGASLAADEPPWLGWDGDPSARYELLLGVDNPRLEHRPWRPEGWVHSALQQLGASPTGQVRLPADFWSELAPGARVYAQVIRIGDDGRAEARSTLRWFEKRR